MSMESDDKCPSDPVRLCLRTRRMYLVWGVVCSAFFALVGVGSTLAALWNIDGSFTQPVLTAWIFGVFWSCFTMLGVWMTTAALRERLLLLENAIVQQRVYSSTRIELREIVSVQWRTRPFGGSVVIRTDSKRITIELHNFTRDERISLIETLRESFPLAIQHDWSLFEAAFPCVAR